MNLHRQSPWPASVAHHDSSSLQTTGNWTDKATYLWAVWPWPGLLPGLLGPPLLLPEALSTATAGSRWPLVASAALLHFHSEAGTLIPGWQLSCRQQEGSLESQPCKDERSQADGGTAHPGWPAAGGPVPENSSLQHPNFWGDQDVQCHALPLHRAGMTPTPISSWSVSPWAGAATRNSTSSCSAVQAFAIIPLHAAPLDAVAEMDSLYDVYLDVRQKWDLEDIVLMGDFNAGCSYMDPSQWASIRLRTNPAFQWLIPDSTDTTATATHCAYDRIVVAGTLLQHAIVPDSATPFDFQAAYGLSSQLVGVLPYVLQLCWDPRTSGSFCINLSHWDQHVVWGPVTKYHVQSRPCTCPHYAFPHRPRPLATITRWR
ncbi:deoxyribonuclease-1 isoform X2 [Phoca vitulina]|uniref:deoxyribonuclease-1 isoform X2 n=1 Tax=Phoca vitulina TaxID=9720 RepID=UPI001395FCA7|nr:deoxyribonuclease-1 isoform X2 [Phoca vitulina]